MKNKRTSGFSLFAGLVYNLGLTSKTNEKLALMEEYLVGAPDRDKTWLIALFTGRRPRRIASGTLLREWCQEITDYPAWLINESYSTVGDLAETIALLLPEAQQTMAEESLSEMIEKIFSLDRASVDEVRDFIKSSWMKMDTHGRFVFNKLLTGNFRIGVSQKSVINAIARVTHTDSAVIAHRISGSWDPQTITFEDLVHREGTGDDSKPYPFFLAHALQGEPASVGLPSAWQAEWKWDGIRGQIIKRNGELYVWSRGEELMTEKFPEYFILKDRLPDGTVLDGEIIAMRNGEILPFNILQTRIGRKNVTKKFMEEAPVGFIAYDLMEWDGTDVRNQPLAERRIILENLIRDLQLDFIKLSEVIDYDDWNELAALRQQSREHFAEGLMVKRKDSYYGAGRKTGDWWKWKIDPLTIDAVMVYAQKGAGRRSNLYTDYTFAVRDGDRLVTFTKAYSGLTDEEFKKVDAFVKKNSIEKFGPVRTVKPELVFEIAFEGIAASNRHKSGVALRFPRISRWRHDKPVEEINTLDDLKEMLDVYGK